MCTTQLPINCLRSTNNEFLLFSKKWTKDLYKQHDDVWPSVPREQKKCRHNSYNEMLVRTGQAETIEQAAAMPRMLCCDCSKCQPFHF